MGGTSGLWPYADPPGSHLPGVRVAYDHCVSAATGTPASGASGLCTRPPLL